LPFISAGKAVSHTAMQYISTRGAAAPLDFEHVTLAGLARDGGLYVPETIPQFSADDFSAMRGLSYQDTAVRVLLPFVGKSLDEATLRMLVGKAYEGFSHSAIAPLVQLDHRHWLLELFHGPTLAFKDFAMQLLGHLFEHFLAQRDTHLTVIGATSGDTGSAAIQALAGRDKVDVFMLHPEGRVSDVQRRQMTTVMAPNIYNIALDGTFDDAQAMVKAAFGDVTFRDRYNLSAVNSINWARLVIQVVYYVYSALRLGAPDRPVIYSVPTGNFGDVFAGYVASRMGLPIEKLIVATNVNDILHRALSSGDYSVSSVKPTSSPSMDIQVSSNFERLLFDLYDRDGASIASLMNDFSATNTLQLSNSARAKAASLFVSHSVDEDDVLLTLRRAQESMGQILDPHTAIGLAAARAYNAKSDAPIVTLATAHPAKFRDVVERGTGVRPAMPARVSGLFDRAERYDRLPNDLAAFKAYIAERMA
jgi:threonine synthase